MKRPNPDAKIMPPVVWSGKQYVPLSDAEIARRTEIRRSIREEGILEAHAEFVKRGGFERIEV